MSENKSRNISNDSIEIPGNFSDKKSKKISLFNSKSSHFDVKKRLSNDSDPLLLNSDFKNICSTKEYEKYKKQKDLMSGKGKLSQEEIIRILSQKD